MNWNQKAGKGFRKEGTLAIRLARIHRESHKEALRKPLEDITGGVLFQTLSPWNYSDNRESHRNDHKRIESPQRYSRSS
jgi:hypothetical protein